MRLVDDAGNELDIRILKGKNAIISVPNHLSTDDRELLKFTWNKMVGPDSHVVVAEPGITIRDAAANRLKRAWEAFWS